MLLQDRLLHSGMPRVGQGTMGCRYMSTSITTMKGADLPIHSVSNCRYCLAVFSKGCDIVIVEPNALRPLNPKSDLNFSYTKYLVANNQISTW